MGSRYSFFLRSTLLISDFIFINGAYIFTLVIMHYQTHQFTNKFHFSHLLLFNFTWLAASLLMGLYSQITISKVENIFRQTIKTTNLQGILFILFLFFTKSYIALKFFIICYAVLAFLFTISRFFVTYISEFFANRSKLKKHTTIIGYNDTGKKIAQFFSESKGDYAFHGFFDEKKENLGLEDNGQFTSNIAMCIDYAVNNRIEEIYSTILPKKHEEMKSLVQVADQRCVRLRFVADEELSLDNEYYHVNYIGGFPIITLRNEPLENLNNRIKKRIFDIVLSLIVTLLLLSWLIPIISLLIILDSKGKVLFSQNRAGRNNRIFRIYKFRTMNVMELDNDFKQATKNDSRITKIGAFLRRTNLDELPQVLNVLIGHMSMIGPRPHVVKLNERYMYSINSYMARHFVKPGITGWAQVNGFRGETETSMLMQKRIEHDIWYMENWSLMLDIKIIFMTIINIFKGEEKAY